MCDCNLGKGEYCDEAKRLWLEVDKVFYKGFSPESKEYQQALEEYRKHFRAWGQRQDWQRY